MNDLNIEFATVRKHELEREAAQSRLVRDVTNRANHGVLQNARQTLGRNLIALGERLSETDR